MYDQLGSILGRALNPAELDFVKKLMTDGQISEFEVGQYLSGLPQQQQKLLDSQTDAFSGRLGQSDDAILGRAAKQIDSRYSGLGRNTTSAQAASLMQAGGALAQNRQSQLADFYGRGLSQIQGNQAAYGQNALARAYQNRDSAVAFGRQNYMYDRYKRDYEDQINTQNRWNLQSGLIQGGLKLGATAAGAALGGPIGGAAGSGLFNNYMGMKDAGYDKNKYANYV